MRIPFAVLFLAFIVSAAHADVDSLRTEVQIALSADKTDIATEKLRQILTLDPDDGATHYQLASLLMDNGGSLFDAAAHYERAGELGFQPQGVLYRLTRIYARTGRETLALEHAEQLAESGFGVPSLVDGHADLAAIQDHPRFMSALHQITAARFPCKADARRHDFDFWIGEWNVTAAGQLAGTNSIQPILGHCTLLEQWESSAGTFGKSFNYYDPGKNHWRQIWIDDTGNVIEFTGEARDGGIFYTAETINPADGSVTLHKFQFTQLENGIVRQYWETSTDDGETWTAIWDGRYERRDDLPPD